MPLRSTGEPVIVATLSHHERPGYAGALIRQRNSRNVDVSTAQQTIDPRIAWARRSSAPPNDGAGPVDHQTSDIAIASLRDPTETLLNPTRSLLLHKATPGCELPASFELPRIGNRCDNRACSNRADTRDRRQPAADLVRTMPGHELGLNDLHPGLDLSQLSRQNAQHLARQSR